MGDGGGAASHEEPIRVRIQKPNRHGEWRGRRGGSCLSSTTRRVSGGRKGGATEVPLLWSVVVVVRISASEPNRRCLFYYYFSLGTASPNSNSPCAASCLNVSGGFIVLATPISDYSPNPGPNPHCLGRPPHARSSATRGLPPLLRTQLAHPNPSLNPNPDPYPNPNPNPNTLHRTPLAHHSATKIAAVYKGPPTTDTCLPMQRVCARSRPPMRRLQMPSAT